MVGTQKSGSEDNMPKSSQNRSDDAQGKVPASPFGTIELLELLGNIRSELQEVREELVELTEVNSRLISPEAMLTSTEVAELFNCSVDRIQQMEREGLPFYRNLGKGHRYMMADVIAFRDARREQVVHGAAPSDLAPVPRERIDAIATSVIAARTRQRAAGVRA